MLKRAAISLLLLIILVIPSEARLQDLVSGKMTGVNDNVKVAFNPESGNALIVWTNSIYDEEQTSRIYGAEMFSHPDGTLEFSEPFMISEDMGNNYRPEVFFLPEFSRYIISWDTSNQNIADYRVAEEDLPGNISHVFLRSYTPRGFSSPIAKTSGQLGGIINISNHNNIRNAFNATISLIREEGRLELLFLYSAKRYSGEGKNFDLLASLWLVEAVETEDESPNNLDIQIVNVDSGKVITEESVLSTGGTYKDGYLYLSARVLNNLGESISKFYKIDKETLKLESDAVVTYDYAETSLNVRGEVITLESLPNGELVEEFRLVSHVNDNDDLVSINNSLTENSIKLTENPLRDEDQVSLIKFFSVDGDSELSGSYILCTLNDTLLRYRKLNPENGKPQGGSKAALILDQKMISSLDCEYCCGKVNLVYTEIISKKKSRVYFATFEVE